MAKYFIKSISIEGFRGINNNGNPLLINFQTDGVTSIFGENGKGKSSIFEAFLYSILGKIIRLDEYHADIKDKKAIKNLFHPNDGHIIIEFIDESNSVLGIDIKVNSNGERTLTSASIADPELFLKSLCNNLNFLDYKSFEKIMISSSEDTGKLFSNLVGFGKFIIIKEKLDKISRTQNINNDFGKTTKETNIRVNNQKVTGLKSEIQTKLGEIGFSQIEYDKNINFKRIKNFIKKQYGITLRTINNESIIDFDNLIKTKIGSTYETDAIKLSSEKETLVELIKLNKSLGKFTNKSIVSLSKKLTLAYKQIESSKDIILGKLFDSAIDGYKSIDDFDINTCILCNTENLGNNQKSFYENINTKIKSFNKFKAQYELFISSFQNQLKSCSILEFEQSQLFESESFFSTISKSQDFIQSDFFETNTIQEVVEQYKEAVKSKIKETSLSIKNLNTKVPSNISNLVETNNVYKFVFNSSIEIDKLNADSDYNVKYLYELENWITYINKIKEEYEDSYNTLMDDISSMIDSDTKIFFKEIMGNVDITPKLKKENKGQKVNILLEKFYTNTTDLKAAPLLSESYRNALSLSIYFAASLKSKNDGHFIIVDDITSSFDSGHQLYLLDLIKRKISINPSNKKGKQIIFLTHDGILKKVLNENNSLKNWRHFTLNSNKDIVSLKPFKSDDLKVIIQNKINSSNYVGSDFRMYYEFVLLEIIEKLNLEIPFSLINSNDNKMVSKLSQAIQEIIEMKRASGKIRGIRFPNKSDFKIHTQQLSNNLSHWASGREISLSTPVLNRIVDDIDAFKRLFQYNCTCPARNTGWGYYKSLTSPKPNGCKCTL